MEITPNTVVVTGAKGHLGSGVTDKLLRNGIGVIAATRSSVELRSGSSRTAIGPGCDLATQEGARQLAEIVAGIATSRLSVVNCVGYFPGYREFMAIDHAEVRRIVDSNFFAVYFSAFHLIPLVIERGGGHFISFTTLSTPEAFPRMTAFDSAKAALEQLTRHLANEFGDRKICANAFALATLRTAEEIQLKPKGDHLHWVDPDEVAGLVADFLMRTPGLLNGNIIKCYNYSDSYYGTSYLDRVSS